MIEVISPELEVPSLHTPRKPAPRHKKTHELLEVSRIFWLHPKTVEVPTESDSEEYKKVGAEHAIDPEVRLQMILERIDPLNVRALKNHQIERRISLLAITPYFDFAFSVREKELPSCDFTGDVMLAMTLDYFRSHLEAA